MWLRFVFTSSSALGLAMLVVSCNSGRPTQLASGSSRRPSSIHPALDPYLRLLQNPELTWNLRDDEGKDLPAPSSPLRAELEGMLRQYAPRVWWHKEEPYGPMDPIDFLKDSSLWLRKPLNSNQQLSPKGKVIPSQLGNRTPASPLTSSGMSPSRAAPLTRPYENEGMFNDGFFIKYEGTAPSASQVLTPTERAIPMFWRLNTGKLAEQITDSSLSATRVIVEYWYHVPFSYANGLGIGNHQGDWEGMAMMIDLSVTPDRKLRHHLRAAYFASHQEGAWHCPEELTWTDGRHPEAFSALGTHATYFAEGDFSTPFITDHTQRGISWDAWQALKPMTLEPYYGYSGAWGDVGPFAFMTGPLVPGPTFKSLPNTSVIEEPTRCLTSLEGRNISHESNEHKRYDHRIIQTKE